jgi:putative FmdB family regulatory protein
MPIYEYDCSGCGERFEIRAGIAEGPGDVICAACGSPDVRRHYGSVAIVGSRRAAPAPGELRAVDGGDLTRDVARRYAKSTGDRAVTEVARRAEQGAGPGELHDIVREAKADRETRARKGRGAK